MYTIPLLLSWAKCFYILGEEIFCENNFCGVGWKFERREIPRSWEKYQKYPLEVFCEKVALKSFVNFTRKHLCCNFIKKRLQHRRFLVKFANFLRTHKHNFKEHLWTTASEIDDRSSSHRESSAAFPIPWENHGKTQNSPMF